MDNIGWLNCLLLTFKFKHFIFLRYKLDILTVVCLTPYLFYLVQKLDKICGSNLQTNPNTVNNNDNNNKNNNNNWQHIVYYFSELSKFWPKILLCFHLGNVVKLSIISSERQIFGSLWWIFVQMSKDSAFNIKGGTAIYHSHLVSGLIFLVQRVKLL